MAVTIPGAVASAAREFGDAPALADTAWADTALADTALADTALADTALAEPALAEPALAEPALAEPGLAEPGLADTALAEPGLAEPGLAEPGLAEPGLAEPDGLRLSYRELDERVTAVAAALIAEGVAPADRVAIWAPNTYHWVLAALGALSAGATLVPVSTRFTGPEALDVISRSGARALFVAGDFLGVDRLAALRAAAAAEDGTGGGGLDKLGLIVRLPEDWAAFERCGASVRAAVVRERADRGRGGNDVPSGRRGRDRGTNLGPFGSWF